MTEAEALAYADEFLENEDKSQDRHYQIFFKLCREENYSVAVLYMYYYSMRNMSKKNREKFEDEKGLFCIVTQENVKQWTGLSRDSYKSGKKRLKELGLIEEKKVGRTNKTYVKIQ